MFKKKSQQNIAPLVIIETTQPLKPVYFVCLQTESSERNIENVLIATKHFTRNAQLFLSKIQRMIVTGKLIWNSLIFYYGFPAKIISHQGLNFKNEFIANLCQLAEVQKIRTSPYYPQTNGRYKYFNRTLLEVLNILFPDKIRDLKAYVPV